MVLLDVRRSSIVLRLQTKLEKDFRVLIKSIARLECFFQNMYANLKLKKSEKRQICVTIQQIPKCQFIQYSKYLSSIFFNFETSLPLILSLVSEYISIQRVLHLIDMLKKIWNLFIQRFNWIDYISFFRVIYIV